MQHFSVGSYIHEKGTVPQKHSWHFFSEKNIMSGPVHFSATSKPSKQPHHRKTDSRCTLHLHGQRHAAVWLHWICAHFCWWKTPAPTPEIFCWALQAGQPCTPPCIEGAGQARPGWSFSPLMGWGEVCRHITKTHRQCDRLPVRRIQGTAVLNYRHTDSVLFGNRTCCTIKAFST